MKVPIREDLKNSKINDIYQKGGNAFMLQYDDSTESIMTVIGLNQFTNNSVKVYLR